jgi:hypothetical protein
MKILAMGLIHKNNTDNQPIEYVYRTLIIKNIAPICANLYQPVPHASISWKSIAG